MPENATSVPAVPRIRWGRAIGAGVIATIVMTIVMMLLKMNLLKMLGSMIVGSDASLALQYTVGGVVHFMIGIIYGIIFAFLVGRVVEWNRFIKGTVYGLAIAAIALAAMPVMSAMLGGGASAQNPCGGAKNPCQAKQTATNPCQPKSDTAMNPCHGKETAGAMNPCHEKSTAGAMNPCHGKETTTAKQPSGVTSGVKPVESPTAMNPCQQKASAGAANPCHPSAGTAGNPCNPCGGSSSPWSGVISVINHLVYALTLAFVYGKVR